jgi:hypothetical protein
LQGTPKRLECTDLWTAIWRATSLDGPQSRGKRHVIVFSSAEEGRIAGHGLVANLQGGRTPLQAISSGPNGQLSEFCKLTRTLHIAGVQEEMSELIEQGYLNLLARYEIAFQPVTTNAPLLKVRIQTPEGWGETTVPMALPSQPEEDTGPAN